MQLFENRERFQLVLSSKKRNKYLEDQSILIYMFITIIIIFFYIFDNRCYIFEKLKQNKKYLF